MDDIIKLKSPVDRIKAMSNKRYELLEQYNKSYNEEKMDYEKELDPMVDLFAAQILITIKEYSDELPFEFIFEELTKLGQAPALLYDDNGYFAITGDGYQEVVTEPSDIEIAHFVEKEQWKPTVREALNHYLNEED